MARLTSTRLDQLAADRSISSSERNELVAEIRALQTEVIVLSRVRVDSSALDNKLAQLAALTARLEKLPVLGHIIPVTPGSGGGSGGGTPLPPPAAGNPEPGVGDLIIVDSVPGGVHDFANYASVAEWVAGIRAPRIGTARAIHHVTTDAQWTSNMDGANTHALRGDYEASVTESSTVVEVGFALDDSNPSHGAMLAAGYKSEYRNLTVQITFKLGKTATGGGNGTEGIFDITDETNSSGNAGCKRLLLCRGPSGCGPRVDHTWGGPRPAIAATTVSSPYNTGIGIDLAAFSIEDYTNDGVHAPGAFAGQEVTFTQIFQASSADGIPDGRLFIYYQGNLVAQRTDLIWGTEGVYSFSFPTTFRGPRIAQSEYFPRLRAWTSI